jgi:membrane protein DedA with SNARE-associated domain
VLTFLALILGTLVSEDVTCIAAGLLIARGQLGVAAGVGGCVVGIFVGDCGLWAIGRGFGGAALRWPWMARRIQAGRFREFGAWLERHAAGAIVASRFLPGMRLPLYVIAGVVRIRASVFAVWSLVAALLWTPTIVLLTASLGDEFVRRLSPFIGPGWPARMMGPAVILSVLRGSQRLASRSWRVRAAARLARWSRWEFWPSWVFYAPVAASVALLAVRHRGFSTITAANPGMTDGGTVGESKFEILSRLPADCTIPSALVRPGARVDRVCQARFEMQRAGWCFPIVVKPDVGQRGMGVKLARSDDDVADYLSRAEGPVVMQPYHPGPFEAGVFYYRLPGEPRGHILSITDKHFPFIVGDGESTVEALIWSHPRCRMQAATFLHRHHDSLGKVLPAGERFQLAIAGNHAQGTLFRDGAHLVTDALERRVDDISQAYGGFFIGRFDIRYRDVEEFKAGRDVAIVELNGAMAESTNIYDPNGSLIDAYRLLFRQWSLVFAIGAANRARGSHVSSHRRLLMLLREHFVACVPFPISD